MFYRDASVEDFQDELIGKKIVEIENNVILLSDGTMLELIDTSDCCAWFSAELSVNNLVDNAITKVYATGDGNGDGFTIHVLAANKKVVDIYIDGDEGSGYYCHSINLEVS